MFLTIWNVKRVDRVFSGSLSMNDFGMKASIRASVSGVPGGEGLERLHITPGAP